MAILRAAAALPAVIWYHDGPRRDTLYHQQPLQTADVHLGRGGGVGAVSKVDFSSVDFHPNVRPIRLWF